MISRWSPDRSATCSENPFTSSTDLLGLTEDDLLSRYVVPGQGDWSAGANLIGWGLPEDGSTLQIPELPEFVVPVPPGTLSASTQATEWTLPGIADWVQIDVFYVVGYPAYSLWSVAVPSPISSFKFPAEPSSLPPMVASACPSFSPCQMNITAIGVDDAGPTSPYETWLGAPSPASPMSAVWDGRNSVAF